MFEAERDLNTAVTSASKRTYQGLPRDKGSLSMISSIKSLTQVSTFGGTERGFYSHTPS